MEVNGAHQHVWLSIFFEISSFVFSWRKKFPFLGEWSL